MSQHTPGGAVLSERCRHAAQSAVLTTRDDAAVKTVCGGEWTAGCMTHYADDGAQVYLSDSEYGQRVETAVHELLHVILECESGNADGGHRWDGWRGAYDTGRH